MLINEYNSTENWYLIPTGAILLYRFENVNYNNWNNFKLAYWNTDKIICKGLWILEDLNDIIFNS